MCRIPFARLTLLAATLLVAGNLGCNSQLGESGSPLPERTVFIAMERDFQDFEDWPSVSLRAGPAQGVTHPVGDRRAFINARPPDAAPQYPVGTIIVQRTLPTKEEDPRYFGMVKRGGDFNTQGAEGWEWFELKPREDGSYGIGWRGLGAPEGDEYGGDPSGTCNNCHRRAKKNDYVHTSALQL